MKAEDPEAAEIRERWHDGTRYLAKARRDLWLNKSFYHDEQWVWWDSQRNRVESLDDNLAGYRQLSRRVYLTVNLMKPNINTLLGKWLQNQVRFDVVPDTTDDATLIGARLSAWIIEDAHRNGQWEAVREQNLFNTLIGGTAAVAMHINDDESLNVSHDRNVSGSNEVFFDPLDLGEFCLEPGSKDQRDARWWEQAVALPPEQVKDFYGMSKTPEADTGANFSAVQRRLLRMQGIHTNVELSTVLIHYERPNESEPDGKVVHVVNRDVVAKTKWPFPFKDRLNMYAFRASKTRGRWLGDTFVTSARPIQAAINHSESMLQEHLKHAGNARAFYPMGFMDDPKNLSDQAGEWVGYYPTGTGDKAYWMTPPSLDRWITSRPAELKVALDDIMHVHDISRGEAPGDRNSGLALSILSEQDETPLAIMARDQQNGWSELASRYIEAIADRSPKQKRKANVTADGVSLEIPWTAEMLKGQFNVVADFDSVAPHSRAARQQMTVRMKQEFPEVFQGMSRATLLRLMDVPGLDKAPNVIAPDSAKAIRENHLMSIGAIMLPADFDDHAKHMAEHNSFRKTTEYESMPDSAKEVVNLHISAHEMLIREEAEAQMEINATRPGLGGLPRANDPLGALAAPTQAQLDAGAEPQL